MNIKKLVTSIIKRNLNKDLILYGKTHCYRLNFKEISVQLDENECVVVYSEENGKILRNIIKGPTQFVPKLNEWIHHFSWHGADPKILLTKFQML